MNCCVAGNNTKSTKYDTDNNNDDDDEVTLSVHCFQVKLEFEMLVFVEEEKPEDPQKNPWSKDKNQKETQSKFDARS